MKSEVHNLDCMKGMKDYPDNYFDLAVVDPPYGISAENMQMGSAPSRKGNGQYPGISTAVKIKKKKLGGKGSGGGKLKNRILNTMSCDWDRTPPKTEYFNELFRISRNQIIWGYNYFNLPASRGVICWDKLQPWDNFSQFELAWTSFDRPAKMYKLSNTGGNNNETKIHPTQKPVKLYEWIFKNYAEEGQKILDTHLGSGSSRIAAYNYKLDFTGYEIDKDYFEAAEKRFKNHVAQLKMFV